ncbi:Imm19 family immunity protein [Pedobacter namyangjuensis]|uniref:Imm19 family immunity protein n=1 Tax=Pedobacter namyangjuensis TaxID=600626 RepID=UPI0013B4208B
MFEKNAAYITYCIVNGLVMEQPFVNSEIGLINNQNHSVRNIEKYPDYKEDVKELNVTLRKFVETGR